MKREYFITFFFEKKKSIDLQKIENHVATFPYWFWFGNFFKKCEIPFGFLITNVMLRKSK
jgi:hypothetical protein